jgi:hypothetical protein
MAQLYHLRGPVGSQVVLFSGDKMIRKRSKLMQVMVVAVVLIVLLAVARLGAAQGERPPLNPEMKRFLEDRIHTSKHFQQLDTLFGPTSHVPHAVSNSQGIPIWSGEIVESGYSLGWGPSLALDQNEQPHISYLRGRGVSWGRLSDLW